MDILIPTVKTEYFETLDSTNNEAKRRFSIIFPEQYINLHKTLIIAEKQSAGRGRLNRNFYSPEKTGVYFSLIYVDSKIAAPAKITASAAVAVCRAISSVFNVEAKIKWVNDVFVGEKKVCGILTEGIINPANSKIEAAIIGIGINILTNSGMSFELKEKVGGIFEKPMFSPNDLSLEDWLCQNKKCLISQTIFELLKILENPAENFLPAMIEYKKRSNLLGKSIIFSPVIGDEKKNYECTVQDITDDAKLLVRLSDGSIRELESGEVTLHID